MIQYTLAGRLESGELADLYRGTRSDGQSVVVKLFHPRTSDAAYARQLAQTVRQLAPVKHAGLVTVFELGLLRKRVAVISDDVARLSLGQALTRLNTKEVLLAPGLAVAMALEMLEAMQLAHQAGVAHGALTPGNVLLTPDGHTAIRDFGALKALFASEPLARQFGARGRSGYRAPENTKGDDLSIEGDIYSVGAILYALLTLKEPSSGDGPNVSTRRGAVPPPSRVDRRLNARIDPVVLRALDPSPARRFRTAQDFAQALRDFLAANGGLPARDEHKRFVATLFPAEVNIEHLGPALFTEPFTLDEVTGAALDPAALVVPEPAPRAPFLTSEVPTQNALPMLDDRGPNTLPELPQEPAPRDTVASLPPPEAEEKRAEPVRLESGQFPSWVAPAAAGPVRKAGKADESDSGTRALERRVRVIEDFQDMGKKPAAEARGGGDSGPVPAPPKERLVLPTSEMPSVHEAEPEAPKPKPPPSAPRVKFDEKLMADQARQRRTVAFYALGLALAGTGTFYYFAMEHSGRVLPSWRPLRGMPSVKAPPFRPDLRAPDPKKGDGQDPVKPVAKERDDPPAAPKEPCHEGPPRKKAALLTVSVTRGVAVRIDGVKVCGNDFTRIPVEPGKRKITVVEAGKGGQSFEAVQRFELGKEVRVVPVFRSR